MNRSNSDDDDDGDDEGNNINMHTSLLSLHHHLRP